MISQGINKTVSSVTPAPQQIGAEQSSRKGDTGAFLGKKVEMLSTTGSMHGSSHNLSGDVHVQGGLLNSLAQDSGSATAHDVRDRLNLIAGDSVRPLSSRHITSDNQVGAKEWSAPLPQKVAFDPDTFDSDAEGQRLQKKYPQCDEWDISGAVSDYEYKRQETEELQYLTVDEYVAISLYSALEYSTVNSALRSQNDPHPVEKMSDWQAFVDDINSGLATLNDVQKNATGGTGALHRGTSADKGSPIAPENVKEGGSLKDPAFLSTSHDPQIAERFANEGDGDITILEHIFGATGGGVENLSEHKFEKEVLFPAGTEFTVLLKHYDAKRQVMKIVAEEKGAPSDTGSQGYAKALLDAPIGISRA